jgi:hypothetical protein
MTRRPAAAVPLPTSRPTPERTRHAAGVVAPEVNGSVRRWWTTVSRLDTLLRDRLIDRPTYDAAQAFNHDYHSLFALSRMSSLARINMPPQHASPGNAHAVMMARSRAVTRLRLVQGRVGRETYDLLVQHVVEDVSWTELGRRLHMRDISAKRRAIRALKLLAEPGP